MKINFHVLYLLGFTVLILVLALNVIAQLFILPSSYQTEQQQSDANIQFVRQQILHEEDQLGTKARDWAVWDDTYRYIIDNNTAYYSAVIAPETTYESLQIAGLLFFNTTGDLVASQGYDLERKVLTSLSDNTTQYFSRNLNLLSGSRGGKKKSGIVTLPDGIFLVGMHTILQTNGEGPGRGTLVMLQPIDDTMISAIGDRLHVPVMFHELSDPAVNSNPVISRLSGTASPLVLSGIRDSSVISGYTLLRDIDNKPVLLLEVDTPRNASREIMSSISILMAAFLITGIIFILVSLSVLRRLVTSPLMAMDATIKRITSQGNLSGRVAVQGDDEIVSLQQTLNGLLRELQDQKSALAEANRRTEIRIDYFLDHLAEDLRNVSLSLKACSDHSGPDETGIKTGSAEQISEAVGRNLLMIQDLETIISIYKKPPGEEPFILEDFLKKESHNHPEEKIRWQDDCAVAVRGDEMLGTALHAIIAFRVKTGGPGIEMTVSARDNNDGTIEISVIDNGSEIPDNMKTQIFDGYIKIPDKRIGYRTGLYSARLIIESLGGRVWVDDRVPGQPERGAVIRFTLKKA